MSKIAIIIIGAHASGKSHLINQFIKKKMDMSTSKRLVIIADKRIYIKSQTLQEAGLNIDDLNRYRNYDILILPSWSNNQGNPTLDQIIERLILLGYININIQWDRPTNDQQCEDVSKQIAKIAME